MQQNLNFESDFSKINTMDWNTLSCLDKALALAASLCHQNAFWNFILRKYSESDCLTRCVPLDYADTVYYDRIGRFAGIKIQHRPVSRNSSYAVISESLKSGNLCVIIINNKFRAGSKHFGIKDHPHFVLITKIHNGICSIIDEPLEREFWKPENYKNGVEYSRQNVEYNSLLAMTQNIDRFAQCLGFQVNSTDDLYCFLIEPIEFVTEKNQIILILNNEIALMVDSAESHIDYINREITKFQKSYFDRYQRINLSDTIDMNELHKSDSLGIKEKTYFPYEWKLAKFHMTYFKTIMRCVSNFVGEVKETKFDADSVNLNYAKLQMLLSRDIIKNNHSDFPHLTDMFIKIYQTEISVLSKMLSLL